MGVHRSRLVCLISILALWLVAPRVALASQTENFSSGTLNGPWPSQWTLEASGTTSFITTTASFNGSDKLGRMSGTSGSGGIQFLTAPGMTSDSEQTVKLALSTNTVTGQLIARRTAPGVYYGCLVGATERLRFYKVVNGVYSQLGSVAPTSPPAGLPNLVAVDAWHNLRFKVTQTSSGTSLQARLWQGTEPTSAWTLELVDNEPALQNVVGYAGIGSAAGTSTNKYMYFDDYEALDTVRLWSAASTWAPSSVPTTTTDVVIPTGAPVRLDVDATVNSIRIPAGATLELDPGSTRYLRSAGNVEVRGTLRMRPATAQQRHTLRIFNAIEPSFIGSQTPDDMSAYPIASDAGVWVLGAGRLDLEGTHKTSWLRASTANDLVVGQTAITMEASPSGWQPNDEIVITPTAYPTEDHSPIYQSEVRKIDQVTGPVVGLKAQPFTCDAATNTSASGNFPPAACPNEDCCSNQLNPPGKSMPTTGALLYDHPVVPVDPAHPKAAEVLNLTRNVVIEGVLPPAVFPRTGNYASAPGRTHLLIQNDVPVQQNIKYVTLRYMGPRKPDPASPNDQSVAIKGRYALHFHHAMDNSIGTTVEGVVVRDSQTHAFVPHASDGITFKDTIAYNTVDDAYWWDQLPLNSVDPGQIMNATTNDVTYDRAVASLVSTDAFFRGYRLSGFLLGIGVGNAVRDSVAVSILGNTNAAGFHWPEQANFRDNVWTTTDLVTHNNRVDGVFVWQNDNHFHNVHGLVAYHNQKTGIEHGAYTNSYRYENGFLYGNGWSGRAGGGFAQIVLNAVSHPSHLITFADMSIDAANRTPSILLVYDVRVNSPTVPMLFLNLKSGGNTGAAIGINLTPVSPPAVPILLADFVNWTKLGSGAALDPATDVSTLNLSAGSTLRFQQGLLSGGACSAQQLTPASSSPQSIACFY